MNILPCLAATLLFAGLAVAQQVFTGENVNEPFTVHGRLSCYNGNPTMRIWIVGSNRILGISEREGITEPRFPARIRAIFNDGRGWFNKEVFADFLVQPLAPDKKGHMRPVRILDATNVVVTLDGKVILNERDKKAEPAGGTIRR